MTSFEFLLLKMCRHPFLICGAELESEPGMGCATCVSLAPSVGRGLAAAAGRRVQGGKGAGQVQGGAFQANLKQGRIFLFLNLKGFSHEIRNRKHPPTKIEFTLAHLQMHFKVYHHKK